MTVEPLAPRCSALSAHAGEPMAGSAPRADVWIVVEHPDGWGDAPLARSAHGVRVVMARGRDGRPGRATHAPAISRSRVWLVRCTGVDPIARVGWVDDPRQVADWNLAEIAAGSHSDWGVPDPEPLLLVCANARRDRCCGHAGGHLAMTLWAGPMAERVFTSTHLGGHRFAPTALLLPSGALHGRLDPASAAALLRDAGHHRMSAATLRGFSTQSAPDQVAEAAARVRSGYDGDRPLPTEVALVGSTRAVAHVRRPDGQVDRVELRQVTHDVVSSCGRAAERTTRWTSDWEVGAQTTA